MQTNEQKEERIKIIFEQNPKLKEFYMCSNDKAFTNKETADGHAGALADQDVKTCKREDYCKLKAPVNPILEGNLEELKNSLKSIEAVEELEALKLEEAADKNRTGALTMIDERISGLNDTE